MKETTILKNLKLIFGICLVFSIYYLVLPVTIFASELQNQFTIGVWVKSDVAPTTKALVAKAEEIRLVTNGSSQPVCQIKSSSTWQTAATSNVAIATNAWAYVSCSYDKATLKVFVNGVQTGSQALMVAVDDTANVFKIGEDDSSGSTYADFSGTVDDFIAYNYARVGDQIMEDYNAGHPAVGTPVGSPVLHLSFDEGYGDTAYDKSPQGNNGDLAGSGTTCGIGGACPAWSNDGKYGKALSFDGTDDYTQVADDPSIDLGTADFTISSWIYPTRNSPPNKEWPFISKTQGTTPSGYLLEASTWGVSGNEISIDCYFIVSGGSIYQSCGGTPAGSRPSINEWSHILVTRVGTTVKFYLNGKLLSTTTHANLGNDISNTANLRIGGQDVWGQGSLYQGRVDEVKIYNFALTADQVKTEYNQGKALVVGYEQGADVSTGLESSLAGNSPVAEWKFDEGTGTTANDTAGGLNPGIFTNGPTWPLTNNCIQGRCVDLDGTNQYVDAGTNSALDIDGSLTVEAWIYPDTYGDNNYGRIVDRQGQFSGLGYSFYMNNNPAGTPAGTATISGSIRTTAGSANANSITLGQWSHVVMRYDSSLGQVKFYVNGVDQSGFNVATTPGSNGTSFKIGDRADLTRSFDGKIDLVKVYNYARTPTQIAYDYNGGEPVAWYKFDECSGTAINDWAPGATPNSFAGHTGTLSIGATGTQTSAGTCGSGATTEAWNNGSTGKFNASMNFDGTDDWVDASGNTSILTQTVGTFSSWVKFANNTTIGAIGGVGNGGDCGSSQWGVQYRGDSNKTIQVYSYPSDGSAANLSAYTPANTIVDTSWHNVVVTVDSANLKVYVDGVNQTLSGMVSNKFFGNAATANKLTVGRHYTNACTNYLNGQIDDVRIYNYALSPAQIKQVYNGGSAVRFAN